MRLWTIQPLEVWEEIQNKGYYICNPKKSVNLNDKYDSFRKAYKWLVHDMESKIGKRPKGVIYPVWAWHTRNFKHKKPDLREAGYDKKGTKSVCIELEVPDNEVVLSDFSAWHFVLNDWYMDNSTCEEEYDSNHAWFDKLPAKEKEKVKVESWQQIYDIRPFENDWFSRGRDVQATFWCMKKEYIKRVQFFVTR